MQLKYSDFTTNVNKEIEESNKFDELKKQEKDLTQKIKKVTDDKRKAENEYVRETDENNQEITDLKKKVNEADVEAKLHIQYLERQIMGAQSCQDRLYKQQETELMNQIKTLELELATELEVNKSVKKHLKSKETELNEKNHAIDQKNEEQKKQLENEKNDIKDKKNAATMEMQRIVEEINKDNEDRKRRDDVEKEKEEEEMAKV